MQHIYLLKLFIRIGLLFYIINLSACSSAKKLNYFNDLPNAEVVILPPLPQEERVIEKGDQLQIVIGARSGEAASFFNKSGAPSGEVGSSSTPSSVTSAYIVDINGFIEFPIIGKIKANGVTALQLKDNLTKSLTPYLKEPLVEVLFTTFNVSFIGDVRSPGTKVLSMQRTTLLEGLAAAGDLPPTAKRFDLLLYRDYKGERKVYRFDMRKKEILNNRDVFQLRHNDVIYVQTDPVQIAREQVRTYTTFISIAVGLTSLALALTRNN